MFASAFSWIGDFFVFLAFILFTLRPLCWIYEYAWNELMQPMVVVGADWTLHTWHHNSSNVGGVTAGQARHNSSNVGVSLRARCDTTLVHIYAACTALAIQRMHTYAACTALVHQVSTSANKAEQNGKKSWKSRKACTHKFTTKRQSCQRKMKCTLKRHLVLLSPPGCANGFCRSDHDHRGIPLTLKLQTCKTHKIIQIIATWHDPLRNMQNGGTLNV